MTIQRNFVLLLLINTVLLLSCNRVDSNPVEAAKDFCEEIVSYADTGDYNGANRVADRYLKSFHDEDVQDKFFIALSGELKKSAYYSTEKMITTADSVKYPSLQSIKINIRAIDKAQKREEALAQAIHEGNRSFYGFDEVAPSVEELESVNAELPMEVKPGTIWTKIEYDDKMKTILFYYNYAQPVDESYISDSEIKHAKQSMVNSLRSDRRIRAGLTYLYIYSSVDGRKLYEIKIDKNDL